MADRNDMDFMTLALVEARRAAAAGEVPIGALVTVGGTVVAAAHNRPIALDDPTAHAEVLALRAAARELRTYRLTDVTLYVTIEPCVMCIGAAINARIARLCFGAVDERAGATGSIYDIGRDGRLNHRIEIVRNVMAQECAALMREFFRNRRDR
ncbi:MAG TPA: tRNA adenosine(34) deaminase TadA [Candidatus Binataceae bacterium]|nr:tRNA adenosine(34) deaminase TadA [Candidatus Binataceae bacterium]